MTVDVSVYVHAYSMDASKWTEDDISCPVCLNVLTDPTTLSCGHNFCIGCITEVWDATATTEVCCCPCCRETLNPRPSLKKNTMLEKMVTKLSRNIIPPPLPTPVQKITPAHVPVHPDQEGREQWCLQHHQPLNVYCREDRKCVCLRCDAEEHQNHETVSVETERAGKQDQLVAVQTRSRSKLQEIEELLNRLEGSMTAMKGSAQAVEDHSDHMFNEMMLDVEKRREEVRKGIRSRVGALVDQAERSQTRLRQNITDLQRRDTDLEKLKNTQDSTLFLQRWQPISNLPTSNPNIVVSENYLFEDVKAVINEFKEEFDDMSKDSFKFFKDTLTNVEILEPPVIKAKPRNTKLMRANTSKPTHPPVPLPRSRSVYAVRPVIPPEIPKCRVNFLQYACQLTLDPGTAHNNLVLSQHNRKVCLRDKPRRKLRLLPQKNSLKRFDQWEQVLCLEGLTGAEYYWEAEWTGKGVYIGVAYAGIDLNRGPMQSGLGQSEKSWSLQCSLLGFSAWHNNVETRLSTQVSSPRIGVFLDHKAGTLAFYSVSDSMTPIHRFSVGEFTEPLYPGFGLEGKSSLRLM